MAIASVGPLGTAAAFASATTLSLTTATNALSAGDFATLTVVTDNSSSTDGDNSEHTSVSGGEGNWAKIAEYTNANGAAAGGVTTSLWLFEATGSVPTGTSITITLAAAVADKTAQMWEFTKAANTTIVQQDTTQTGQVDAASNFASLSISGLPSAPRLYFRASGKEANIGTTGFTATSGFTSLGQIRSRNNASAVGACSEFRLNTSTGETSNPTLATSGDTADIFVALVEQATTEEKSGSAEITHGTSISVSGQKINLIKVKPNGVALTNLSGAFTDIDEDPYAPDGSWLVLTT
jgi:hypothetical protein